MKDLERRWLRRVAEQAGYMDANEFFAAVDARLEKGANEYGHDAYLDKPVSELVSEAREEGVDFPAWCMLAVQRFEHERENFPPEVADHIERILIEAAARVLQGWYAIGMALEFYNKYRPEPVGVAEPPHSLYFED